MTFSRKSLGNRESKIKLQLILQRCTPALCQTDRGRACFVDVFAFSNTAINSKNNSLRMIRGDLQQLPQWFSLYIILWEVLTHFANNEQIGLCRDYL